MEIVAILVEELHLVLIEDHAFDAIFRAEPVLGLRAGLDIAQLGLHHPAPVAGRDVGNGHDAPEVFVVLDDHTRAQLRRLNQHLSGHSRFRCEGLSERWNSTQARWARQVRDCSLMLRSPCRRPLPRNFAATIEAGVDFFSDRIISQQSSPFPYSVSAAVLAPSPEGMVRCSDLLDLASHKQIGTR